MLKNPNEKPRREVESLIEESTRYLFEQRLKLKLEKVDEFPDTEEMYAFIKNCIQEAANKAIGQIEDRQRSKQQYRNEEIEKKRQEKNKLFKKWLSTKDQNDRTQYKAAQAKIHRMIRAQKNLFWRRNIQKYKHT